MRRSVDTSSRARTMDNAPATPIPNPRVRVSVTADAIDESSHLEFCRDPFAGAVSVFVGTTRNTFNGHRVLKLSYECYEEMALAELRRIAREMIEKYGGDGDEFNVVQGRGGHGVRAVSIEHRLGDVGVGETSVVIVASASHRRDASDATAYAIEALKARVPIWKKETFVVEDAEGGGASEASEWKANNLGVFAKKE